MRILLYTLAMAVLPMLAQANDFERGLEGYWDNYQTQTTIKVKAKRYGFKVKGIYGKRKWTKFRKNHRGQYRDSRGNKLVIRHRNRIEFVNRHNRLITPFRRQVSCGNGFSYGPSNRGNYNVEYYDYYGGGYQDGYYSNRDRNLDDQGGYYRGDGSTRRKERTDSNRGRNKYSYTPLRIDDDQLKEMEGTWKSEGRNGKKVIIVSTRDGIKVKDTTNDKWYRYRLSSDRKSLIDDKGNLYQMGKKSLFWTSNNSKRILKLEKTSHTTF